MMMSFSFLFLSSLLLFSSASYVFVSLLICFFCAYCIFCVYCLLFSICSFHLFFISRFSNLFSSFSPHLLVSFIAFFLCPSILIRAFSSFSFICLLFSFPSPLHCISFGGSLQQAAGSWQQAAGSRQQAAGSRQSSWSGTALAHSASLFVILSRIPPVSW